VPLSSAFKDHGWIERARRFRANPLLAYGLALLVVAAATLLRMLLGAQLPAGVPFTTFYPAVLVAGLGGVGPGVFALALFMLASWFFFIPPVWSFYIDDWREMISLALFLIVSGTNVALVALFNAAMDRLATHEKNTRVLIENAPNGIVVVDDHGKITLVNSYAEKQFGYGRRDLIGKVVETLAP